MTREKLERHCQERPTEIGTYLERGRGSGPRETREALEYCPKSIHLDTGRIKFKVEVNSVQLERGFIAQSATNAVRDHIPVQSESRGPSCPEIPEISKLS